ncbi:GNAT family N-acetyltransferase [Saccharibacillus sp. O16]|nr:GNAT family N-acetyltransferase [Saccharibacillus sp. O16]
MYETSRLLLREYTLNDLNFLMSMTSDPETMRYIGDGSILDEEQTKERLERYRSRYSTGEGLGLRLAIRKEDHIPVGHAGLIPQIIEGTSELEVGYWLAGGFRGQGYATELAIACRDYGFQVLGKQRLVSIIKFDNLPSIQVAKKNGMSYEKAVMFNGQRVALYAIER